MDKDIFIYTNPNSLSKIICDEIIENFEVSNKKYDGLTIGGVNKDVKNTIDCGIQKNDIIWSSIYKLLKTELIRNVKIYVDRCTSSLPSEYKLFENGVVLQTLHAQKYNRNSGKYVYHSDKFADGEKVRVITFIWYLNDVLDGGETEFIDFKIKPETGKLLLFPATWSYPHRGNMPLSSDKYIITGWLYQYHR